MANEAMTATDPLGNVVSILEGTCMPPQKKNASDVYDDVVTVIQKPAIMIRGMDERTELYYFRSVGWHHTILLVVHFTNERWETAECIQNPSTERLSDLLKKGKQVL